MRSFKLRNLKNFVASALTASVLVVPMPTLVAAEEANAPEEAGQLAFNTHCRNCHSIKPEDNRLGPSLHGIYGKPAGQVKGFGNYSGGLTPDMTWDDATLDKFLTNPQAVASNTTMKPFPGVGDAAQRKLIIDYLKANGE